jgi:hypothetical protein
VILLSSALTTQMGAQQAILNWNAIPSYPRYQGWKIFIDPERPTPRDEAA